MWVMKVLKKNVFKCLQERKVVVIGILIPDTINKLIMEVIKVMGIGLKIPDTLPQVIGEVVEVGQV